jgi:hypothetical protein
MTLRVIQRLTRPTDGGFMSRDGLRMSGRRTKPAGARRSSRTAS